MMVVIKGLAIKAGSTFTSFAKNGSTQPKSLATTTEMKSEMLMDMASANPPGYIMTLMKFTKQSARPARMDTCSSFRKALPKSFIVISPTAMLLIIIEELWLPAFPPASMSMGMKATKMGMAATAAS